MLIAILNDLALPPYMANDEAGLSLGAGIVTGTLLATGSSTWPVLAAASLH